KNKLWTREISPATNLIGLFSTVFVPGVPEPVHQPVLKSGYNGIIKKYGYGGIVEKENDMAAAKEKLEDSLRHEYITKPHLEISFQKMSFTSTTRATTTIRNT